MCSTLMCTHSITLGWGIFHARHGIGSNYRVVDKTKMLSVCKEFTVQQNSEALNVKYNVNLKDQMHKREQRNESKGLMEDLSGDVIFKLRCES